MAPKLTHTVKVSETPKERDDSDSKQKKQLLALPEDQWVRERVQSIDKKINFRKADHPWRPRLISAPPNAAVKYSRQLRRITDELDVLLDKGPRHNLPSDEEDVERQTSITDKAVPQVLKLSLEP